MTCIDAGYAAPHAGVGPTRDPQPVAETLPEAQNASGSLAASGAVVAIRGWASRHHRLIAVAESIGLMGLLTVTLLGAGMALSQATASGRLDPAGLVIAVGAESVSFLGFLVIPRWLLRSQGIRLPWSDVIRIGMGANAISVFVPGGGVVSSLWAGHQYQRRFIPTPTTAWTIVAGGFASTVTLLVLLVSGAAVDGLVSPRVAVTAVAVLLIVASGLVTFTHRAGSRLRPSTTTGSLGTGRVHRAAVMLGEVGSLRAGTFIGGGVLGMAALNWVADAAALGGAFVALGVPVPWAALLFAYCSAQGIGALLPLPGGVGGVEGGLVGGLVIAGATSPARAVTVIALYRAIGYWAPAAAGVPAYLSARRAAPSSAAVSTGSVVLGEAA